MAYASAGKGSGKRPDASDGDHNNSSRHNLKPMKRLLIANRGEIAIRITEAAAELGITKIRLTGGDWRKFCQQSQAGYLYRRRWRFPNEYSRDGYGNPP